LIMDEFQAGVERNDEKTIYCKGGEKARPVFGAAQCGEVAEWSKAAVC